MPNASTPATGEAMPACPVLPLALRLGAARSRTEELDRKHTAARRANQGFPANYLDSAHANAYDEEMTLRDLISSTEATSLEGAAVQLVEAISRVEAIYGAIPERDADAVKDHRAADRMLYSALRVIVRHCGQSPNEIAGSEIESRNCDPWTPVEERIAEVRRRSDEEASKSKGAGQ